MRGESEMMKAKGTKKQLENWRRLNSGEQKVRWAVPLSVAVQKCQWSMEEKIKRHIIISFIVIPYEHMMMIGLPYGGRKQCMNEWNWRGVKYESIEFRSVLDAFSWRKVHAVCPASIRHCTKHQQPLQQSHAQLISVGTAVTGRLIMRSAVCTPPRRTLCIAVSRMQ